MASRIDPSSQAVPVIVRAAQPEDVPVLHQLIRDLAEYERRLHECVCTAESLERDLFERQICYALLAVQNQSPVGFALYFLNYSTFLGKPGIYLEDLYVRPEARGLGAGKALLQKLAEIAVANDYGRIDWAVLDWNESAIRFYESIGAMKVDEWDHYRMQGPCIQALAKLK